MQKIHLMKRNYDGIKNAACYILKPIIIYVDFISKTHVPSLLIHTYLMLSSFHPTRPYIGNSNKVIWAAAGKTKWSVHPVWSESSLCAQWVAKDPGFFHADSEGWSDWADAQADLSLCWAHRSFCWLCHAAAHFFSSYIWPLLTSSRI